MALESFRELLIKRSEDPELTALIKFIRGDIIIDIVHESLEKMARAKHKGIAANNAVRHFATEMDPETIPRMIHDALGHHVSGYKKAINSGNKDVANEHAREVFRIVDMADLARKHTEGKLDVSAPALQPWERNGKTNKYTADDAKVKEGKYQVGEFKTKTKGFSYRGKDFSWLQNNPHESYQKEINQTGQRSAYPFEDIKVNGKSIVVNDNHNTAGFTKHEFDKHPIMTHFEESTKSRTPERDQEYRNKAEAYEEGPHMGSYFDRHEKMMNEDPEEYARRGSYKASPVHSKKNETTIDLGYGATPKDSFSNIDQSKLSPAMQQIAQNQGKPKE